MQARFQMMATRCRPQKVHASTVPAMAMSSSQDKQNEIAFFDGHAAADAYDVFTPATNDRLIDAFVALSRLPSGSRVVDLGCGSGVFTDVLQRRGYRCSGVDLSPKLIEIARAKFRDVEFVEGDVERLSFADKSFDGVLLSGLVHHLPDPSRCAAEVFRILRPGGKFVAFDPNRMNPFMYLYRDRSSPFYSPVGRDRERTAGARPRGGWPCSRRAGFTVSGRDYLSGLAISLRGFRQRARLAAAGVQLRSTRSLFALGLHASGCGRWC